SDEVRASAAAAARNLRHTLAQTLDARWVPSENLHITVRFIGYVSDEGVSAMLETLTRPLDMAPFEIEFGGCGRFPPRGAPRVLWIRLSAGLSSLAALHEAFNRRVAPLGYAPETRPFSAHLTLARIKDARGSAKSVDAALHSVRTDTVTQRVETVTVFESQLSPRGSVYKVMRRIRLSS
ncbi:MAG TPA: RNA 2',3'-cyclic phosphodiesterase, partial [Vicinamibacterales bacterium]|nr:RNA 2',3'-cyclic phosphodiesterase [Vicinamibacterales bacterium]